MSVLIPSAIPRRGFELIRDRICQILIEEFGAQLIYSGDYDLQLHKVYMERLHPFSHTELPALNVGIERGDEESHDQTQSDWVYRFFIECNTKGATDGDSRGDMIAKIRVEKLLGIAMNILENPAYKTLGFPAGQLIKHTHCESFVFAESTREDAENTTMTRFILVVKAVERKILKEADLLVGWDTRVKLHESEQGYYWSKQE